MELLREEENNLTFLFVCLFVCFIERLTALFHERKQMHHVKYRVDFETICPWSGHIRT